MAEYLIQGETLTAIADAIRAKTGKTDVIPVPNMPSEIAGITSGGGGSSEDVRYVTFMSEDGTVELGKKAVAVGDDCADPIAREIFETPTRESDVQYDYTFYGWATTPNGAADSNWSNSITEDKTVYANFISAVRYYTITYYDSDGTTVLKTESLAYGATPSYSPTKQGYKFNGWEPELTTVTGDASYYAQFTEQIAFESASWEQIAAVCESGEAATAFALGDTRLLTLTYADGTTEDIEIQVAGFSHFTDLLEDGTKASISIVAKNVLQSPRYYSDAKSDAYKGSDLRTWLTTDLFNALPADLQQVIKAKKVHENSSYDMVWLPCIDNLYSCTTTTNKCSAGPYDSTTNAMTCGTYDGIRSGVISGAAAKYGETENQLYYSRYKYNTSSGYTVGVWCYNSTGEREWINGATTQAYVRFGFCI